MRGLVAANDDRSGARSLAHPAAIDGPVGRGDAGPQKTEHERHKFLVPAHLHRPLVSGAGIKPFRLSRHDVERVKALTDILDFRAVKK